MESERKQPGKGSQEDGRCGLFTTHTPTVPALELQRELVPDGGAGSFGKGGQVCSDPLLVAVACRTPLASAALADARYLLPQRSGSYHLKKVTE